MKGGSSVILLAILPLLLSCGPQFYARKAEKAIRKLEQLGGKWEVDTAYVAVEIPVPVVRADTFFITTEQDTVVLERERLRVQVIREYDTLRVEAECKADTVEVEVPVTIEKKIEVQTGLRWWWLVVAAAAGALVGVLKR